MQKKIFTFHTRPDADMSGRKDPPIMGDLVKRLQAFGWTDHDGCPLPDELIVAAIRAASFNFDLATDILALASNQDPLDLAFASTPGQEKYVRYCTSTDYRMRSGPEPINMGDMIETLRALELTDDEGRPLCTEVLAEALRYTFYRVFGATELLLAATEQSVPIGYCKILIPQGEAITKLKQTFPGLDWSTLAKASADANKQIGKGAAVLIEIASRIEELEPNWTGVKWY
jgi:hypothetical protein